jgi:hypothetical protein
MAEIESLLSENAVVKKRRIRMLISIIVGVILLHVAGGIVAGIFIVAKYIFPPPANFVVKKDVRLPAKKREHKMNMAALDAIAPKPTLNDKMQSTRPTAFSLPDVPDMPLDQMLPMDPSKLLADQLSSLSNTEALGSASGSAAAGGGGIGGKGISFLGVNTSGKRILLLIDVSQTVVLNANKAGYPYEKVAEDAQKLFSGLPITARFGMAEFNEDRLSPFRESLVPNGATNRKAALPWIASNLAGSNDVAGSGWKGSLAGALVYAQKVKPDLIFILTDADYRDGWGGVKTGIESIRSEDGAEPQINFIVFCPKEIRIKELKEIARGDKIKIVVKQ